THRGMELSAHGGALIIKNVDRALELLDEAENKLMELKSTATGTIRIGASDTIFEYFLAEKLVEYRKKFPAVKFELLSDVSPKTVEQLKSNKCDVGFLNLPIQEDDEIVISSNVMHLNDVFIANENFIELKDVTVPLNELEKYPMLLMDSSTVARKAITNFAQGMGVNFRPDIEVSSWDLMKRLAKKGMGIGCIPREYAQRELVEKQSLFEVKTTPSLPVRSVGIALPKGVAISYALREFIKLFKNKEEI
ncbi:MAG: LysR family transcriptional regulator substrate-binding protein, partial [Clostridia bacterium]|nr:LysR family transcriptional regulator substrate-binding protein [Clostridia bacterium]